MTTSPAVWCPRCRRMQPSTTEEQVFPTVSTWGWVGKAKLTVWRCQQCRLVVKSEETA